MLLEGLRLFQAPGLAMSERRVMPAAAHGDYAGDIPPLEAWRRLCADESAALVDVRTVPEWQFTGQPDLTAARGPLISAEWKRYPAMELNPHFADQLRAQGARETGPLF